MHSAKSYIIALGLCLSGVMATAQSQQTMEQIGHLLEDALFVSDKYLTPAADAAIYQSSSAWLTTAKSRELWDVTIGVNANVFFVPKRDRSFTVNNSDFSFFTIENATTAELPTALGNDDRFYLTGEIDDNGSVSPVRMRAPEGIDTESITYPYLQASVGLPFGTELIAKYSTKVKLKKGHYQVYGAGLKHTVSRYFPTVEAKNVFVSVLAAYSHEDISFSFLDTETQFGNLGLNQISGLVNTWQFQASVSKKWNKFELMSSVIGNTSQIKYEVGGPKGEIENILPVQYIVNERLKDIYKTKTNVLGEISGRYQIGKIYLQSAFAFGKFANANFSIQYEII
ncbi:MAG: hypothetical protein ITG00_05520 [Flavobacterium sp.]|nr:hypothetical protein [Flavobacterium sp.]